MRESVAAVVVTYNRARLLLECLDALLRQTRPVDKIVLIDNASTDGTVEALRSGGYMDNPQIDYQRSAFNSGGAGGFHDGMKRAYELGFDWIWVMDDDAEPFSDALEKMEPSLSDEGIGGVANLTIGLDGLPQLEHRGWLELRNTTSRAFRAIDLSTLAGPMKISFASFVGLAVHRTAIERIGLPKREMFIKSDDLEYCVRLASIGPLVLVPDSKIRHKDGALANSVSRSRFGKTSDRVPLEKLTVGYFALRNLLWIRRQNCGAEIAARYAARRYLRLCVGIMVFDSHRLVRLRFFWNAIMDGWHGTFDNDKPRRLTSIGAAKKT